MTLRPLAALLALCACDAPEHEPAALVRGARAELHPDQGSIIVVEWAQPEPTDWSWVEYSVDPDIWLPTPASPGTVGEHRQIIVGVPFESKVSWRVVGALGEATTTSPAGSIRTADLPARLPPTQVDLGDPASWQAGADFLFTSVTHRSPFNGDSRFWLVILDRQGRYVWAQEGEDDVWTLFARPSKDGRAILWDQPYFWSLSNSEDSRVYRQRLDGTIEHSWSTPGLHHSFDEIDSQTILFSGVGASTDRVMISEGEEPATLLWDCQTWLLAEGLVDPESNHNCGANSITWHEPTDQIVLSLFSSEAVLAIDRQSAEVLWFAEPYRALGLAVDPVWAWQHDAHLLDEDSLLLFSGIRQEGDERGADLIGSAVYQYRLDLENGRLDLEWSLPSDEWVSNLKGGATRLPDGNTLVNYGDLGGVREFDADGAIVWELNFDTRPDAERREHWVGRTTFIDDLYAMTEETGTP